MTSAQLKLSYDLQYFEIYIYTYFYTNETVYVLFNIKYVPRLQRYFNNEKKKIVKKVN